MFKSKPSFILFLAILIFTSGFINAQLSDYSLKYGMNFNMLIPDTEFDNDQLKFQYMLKGLLRIPVLEEYLEGELSLGYGFLAGNDFNSDFWKSEMIPIEARLLISPLQLEEYNPFLYAGFGSLFYWVDNSPKSVSPYYSKKSGATLLIPVGMGIEFRLSDHSSLELSGGYNFTFSDHLNAYNNYHDHSGGYDGYWNIGIGFNIFAGSGNSDDDNDGIINSLEKEIGTDPENSDSDNDGLNDGDEINRYKTDPLSSDSDGDGINDSDEIWKYKTNPLKGDTDEDKLSDYQEVFEF